MHRDFDSVAYFLETPLNGFLGLRIWIYVGGRLRPKKTLKRKSIPKSENPKLRKSEIPCVLTKKRNSRKRVMFNAASTGSGVHPRRPGCIENKTSAWVSVSEVLHVYMYTWNMTSRWRCNYFNLKFGFQFCFDIRLCVFFWPQAASNIDSHSESQKSLQCNGVSKK